MNVEVVETSGPMPPVEAGISHEVYLTVANRRIRAAVITFTPEITAKFGHCGELAQKMADSMLAEIMS